MTEALATVHATLDKKLDVALPFDDESLGQLRDLIDWLAGAITAVKSAKTVAPFSVNKTVAAPIVPVAVAHAPGVSAVSVESC